MSAGPKLYGLIGVGVALVQSVVSCTLTSDPYNPIDARAPLQTAVTGGTPDAGAPATTEPLPVSQSPSCPSGNEVAGCDIELLPGACSRDSDCESGFCRGGNCQPASCDDGLLNQDEAGLDCGGSACPRCDVGTSCGEDADCGTGVCGAGGCGAGVARCCQAPSCDDGVANGSEPVADCGDATCGLCPDGSACNADAQCASELCQAETCRPLPCGDGVRNGSETDTDCGGNAPECARCVAGDTCAADGDCVSRNCLGGRCSSCGDGERNGSESGVDCGGACGPCAPGGACRVDADCQSAACEDGRCCGGTLVDCTRCARRLSQTLACSNNGPTAAPQCEAFLDCLANNPDVCPVRYNPGCSDDPGGVCNHTAFGTNTGPGVGLADAILGTAGCTFGDE
jgi:hypothetical protein